MKYIIIALLLLMNACGHNKRIGDLTFEQRTQADNFTNRYYDCVVNRGLQLDDGITNPLVISQIAEKGCTDKFIEASNYFSTLDLDVYYQQGYFKGMKNHSINKSAENILHFRSRGK